MALCMPRADADVINVSEGALRTSKLEETLVEGARVQPATERTSILVDTRRHSSEFVDTRIFLCNLQTVTIN